MKRKGTLFLAFLLTMTILSFASLYTIKKYRPREYKRIVYYARKIFYESSKPLGKEFPTKIKRDRYALHLNSARSQNIGLIEFDKCIETNIKADKLVNVKSSAGFKIFKLTHSSSVLSKKANAILIQIGKEFISKTNDQYFTVTSLTRSEESQKKLRKVNHNASRGISSHSYGASFDISYIRFNGERKRNQKLKKELETILLIFQKEHKIYVIYERRNKCYHITVI